MNSSGNISWSSTVKFYRKSNDNSLCALPGISIRVPLKIPLAVFRESPLEVHTAILDESFPRIPLGVSPGIILGAVPRIPLAVAPGNHLGVVLGIPP